MSLPACLSLWKLCCAPLQWYRTMLCTISMHVGATVGGIVGVNIGGSVGGNVGVSVGASIDFKPEFIQARNTS